MAHWLTRTSATSEFMSSTPTGARSVSEMADHPDAKLLASFFTPVTERLNLAYNGAGNLAIWDDGQ
ncbi:hypothetical protein ACTXT7_006340 [Hymenolepis weldensis]